jgi:hypothetical protein
MVRSLQSSLDQRRTSSALLTSPRVMERYSTSWDERTAVWNARKDAGNITWEVDWEFLRNGERATFHSPG